MTILSFCITHGLHPQGPCHECRRDRDRRRGSSSQRGYGAAWRKLRAHILERDRHTCQVCGERATQVDHIVPRSKGGTDNPANLRASCGWCNRSKGGSYDGPEQPPRRDGDVWVIV
jgi:5-methylcytosine-specific restriction enzyme A